MDGSCLGLGTEAGDGWGLPLACESVEVDQSFGALLMMCGLCTVPNHGEHCSTGAVRRRRAGEAKGLSRSGVNGAVRGLCGPPTMERAKTEAGVFNIKVGLGLIRSSVPEVTDVSDEVFLSLPVDSDLALPLVATVS